MTFSDDVANSHPVLKESPPIKNRPLCPKHRDISYHSVEDNLIQSWFIPIFRVGEQGGFQENGKSNPSSPGKEKGNRIQDTPAIKRIDTVTKGSEPRYHSEMDATATHSKISTVVGFFLPCS